MAYNIVPQDASAKPAASDPSFIDGPKWNKSKKLTGGGKGDLLVFDDTQTSGLNGIPDVTAGQFLRSMGASSTPVYALLGGSATVSTTGTTNDATDVAGLLNAGAMTHLRLTNASLRTINGLTGGVDGAFLLVDSIGAGQVDIANQAAGSSAANRFVNPVTGTISLAPGTGRALFVYDGSSARFRCVFHEQGDWIDIAYSAGNFTTNSTGSWALDNTSFFHRYYLRGRTLSMKLYTFAGTVGVTTTQLRVAIPGGFSARNISDNCGMVTWADGSSNVGGSDGRGVAAGLVGGAGTFIQVTRYDNFTPTGAGFPAVAATFSVFFTVDFQLT